MRVGVELMMTNISAAKSSLRPSKMMHGTLMRLASSGGVLQVEMQRGKPVLAVDDQVLGRSGPAGGRRRSVAIGAEIAASRWCKSSTVPGIGGWVTAVS